MSHFVHLILLAAVFTGGVFGVTMTFCELRPPGAPPITQTGQDYCSIPPTFLLGHAQATSTFFLQGGSGYGSADGFLNTSTYGEVTPNQVIAEALGTFEYGAQIVTPGPERPGYVRYRFLITTAFNSPDSGITTWIGDTVFDDPEGGGCQICTGPQFLPVTLGKDISLYFLGRSHDAGSSNGGSTQQYSLQFSVLEADQITLVSDMQLVQTPEPGGLVFVGIGLGALLFRRRR